VTEDRIGKLRFLGRHRCPQCRMPLRAEEITCALCQLEIVYVDDDGEIMVRMVAIDDPSDWQDDVVQAYHTMLAVENSGDVYFPKEFFPTISQHADIVELPDGSLGVRYANRVTLGEIRRTDPV
jgi:hypothetical protein